MVQPGDIVQIVINQTGHGFTIGEKVEVKRCIDPNAIICKGSKRSDLLHVNETSPVWDK